VSRWQVGFGVIVCGVFGYCDFSGAGHVSIDCIDDRESWNHFIVRNGKPVVILDTFNPHTKCLVANCGKSSAAIVRLRVERRAGRWENFSLTRGQQVSLGPCADFGPIRTVHAVVSGGPKSVVMWRTSWPHR
jgi:hypothetical protein